MQHSHRSAATEPTNGQEVCLLQQEAHPLRKKVYPRGQVLETDANKTELHCATWMGCFLELHALETDMTLNIKYKEDHFFLTS